MSNREVPIFFDPDQKRWPRLRRGVFLSGLILSTVFGILVVSIIVYPALPQLDLPQRINAGRPITPFPKGKKVETPRESALHEAKEKLEIERSKRAARLRVQPAHSGFDQPLTIGF